MRLAAVIHCTSPPSSCPSYPGCRHARLSRRVRGWLSQCRDADAREIQRCNLPGCRSESRPAAERIKILRFGESEIALLLHPSALDHGLGLKDLLIGRNDIDSTRTAALNPTVLRHLRLPTEGPDPSRFPASATFHKFPGHFVSLPGHPSGAERNPRSATVADAADQDALMSIQ
jgi:hypothetical protein